MRVPDVRHSGSRADCCTQARTAQHTCLGTSIGPSRSHRKPSLSTMSPGARTRRYDYSSCPTSSLPASQELARNTSCSLRMAYSSLRCSSLSSVPATRTHASSRAARTPTRLGPGSVSENDLCRARFADLFAHRGTIRRAIASLTRTARVAIVPFEPRVDFGKPQPRNAARPRAIATATAQWHRDAAHHE